MSSRLKPKSCEGCPLYEVGEGWVPAELRPSDVLLVGEAPGEHEAKQGRPFVGQSGWLLSRLLRRLGLEREAVSIHNCLSCRPPGNELIDQPWAGAALTHCKPNLLETINRVQPKVIVALGGTALQTLTGYTKIQSVRGFPLRGPQGIWIVPTFHPSFLLPGKGRSANAHLHGAAIHDLKRALEIAENGFQREEVPTVLDPSPLEWSTTEVPRLLQMEMLSIDIETPMKSKIQDEQEILEIDSTIVRIAFCGENGASVSIPWQAGYLQGIRQLLASQQVKIWWNGYAFDVPVLEENGCEVNGPQWDGMWAFAMLQSALPRGLQNVASYFAPEIGPWKHLSNAEPARYNAIDAYAAMKNMLGIREALQNQGRWGVFEEHVVQAWVALKQGGKVNGVYIDLKEQRILGEELAKREGELISDAQSMVPKELLPRKRYKKFPLKPHPSEVEFGGKYYIYGTRTFEPVRTLGKTTRCSKCGAEGVTKTAHLKGGKKNPCHGATIEKVEGTIEVYDELLPFNPKSEKQIKAYAKHFRHALKKNYKTDSETTDKKFIDRMIKKHGKTHPIYPLIQELSGISKTKGTYVDGFAPDSRGRVYSEYTFAPSTGRLCIAKDTVIEVVRDRSRQQQIFIQDVQPGDEVFTISDDLQLTTRKVLWAGKTGHKKVVRVHWESGTGSSMRTGWVDMTPDHPVRLVGGDYKEAQYLQPCGRRGQKSKKTGDRIIGLTSYETSYGYVRLRYTGGLREGEFEHKVVAGEPLGNTGFHIHHKNGSKKDNRPQNLERLPHRLHAGLSGWNRGRMRTSPLKAHLAHHLPYKVAWCGYDPMDCGNHRVTKVEWLEESVDVYDLEVEETHNFFAGELCVHNSSRNVNMQNISKNSDNPWAKRIRKTIIPPPGHVFLEVDSAAIEAVLVGYFANDPLYMERALSGIHAFLCTVSLGIDFNPETVKWVKDNEPSLYARKKRTVHGCFTEGHELLTPEGWKKIEDISDEERIATWNPERKISFETPSQWTRKPITEDVIRFESQNFSAETTWDHRWPVLTSSGNVVDYVSETIPKANAFPGVGIKPDGEWVDPRLIRRLVAIEADGSIAGNKVRFHVKKPRKVAALLELGARYVEETSKGTHRLIFDDASKEISMLSPGKVWNIERLLSWDLPSRQCWLQELPKWDGDQKRTYRTTKDVCKDAVQAVAAISGERSTTMLIPKREGSFGNKPCWHVRIGGKRKDIALESVSRKKVFYEGMIHCPTVSSGYVVFRHCGKVGISGNCNFGMSAPLMTMTYPDVFPSKATAQREIDFYLEVCPSLKEWHNAVREQAHRMGYLQNPFGYRHYFYDVLHKRPDGSVSLGSDANRVLAFFPQSTAAAFMRANLARLGRSEWLPYLPANLSIHDALILAPPESRIEEALEYLISLMNREIPELGGLRIGCEATLYRKNWSEGEVIRVVH